MKRVRTGFTLIELLVVIAIIGILSAVILASLGTARAKGDDAGVLANVSTVVTQSAIYSSNSAAQNYGTLNNGSGGPVTCPKPNTSGSTLFNDPTVENAIAAAVGDSSGGTSFCYASGNAYAVAVSRPSGVVASKSYFWCADSTGIACGNDGNGGDAATPIVNGQCASCTIND